MKIVTYATHSEGTFDELVKNPYGIEVVVLGWGTKWRGFMDKIKTSREYLDTLFDNEIVVFVDGFDSYILKPIDDLEDKFKYLNCDILVSKNKKSYLSSRLFGTCKDNTTANSGLYMGYAGALKNLLTEISLETSSDDQRNLNSVCKKFLNLKIDTDSIIFKNIDTGTFQGSVEFKNTEAYFGQTPGIFTVKRKLRGLREYPQFVIPEILLVVLLIIFFLLKK